MKDKKGLIGVFNGELIFCDDSVICKTAKDISSRLTMDDLVLIKSILNMVAKDENLKDLLNMKWYERDETVDRSIVVLRKLGEVRTR